MRCHLGKYSVNWLLGASRSETKHEMKDTGTRDIWNGEVGSPTVDMVTVRVPCGSPATLKVCIQFLVYYMSLVLHVCVWEPKPCSLFFVTWCTMWCLRRWSWHVSLFSQPAM